MSINIAEITTFLERHHLFAMLPSAILKDLAHKCEFHKHDIGEVVYTVGDEEAQQRQREIADWLTAYSDITQPPQSD